MKKLSIFLLSFIILNSCKEKHEKIITLKESKNNFTSFVNPFIGTSKMGGELEQIDDICVIGVEI